MVLEYGYDVKLGVNGHFCGVFPGFSLVELVIKASIAVSRNIT
jgi:6-phosphogluconolactonase/glucosamine-6-phosphate isomerase/deaminase